MASKYTDAERAAYKAGVAAAGGKPAKKAAAPKKQAAAKSKPAKKSADKPKRASGCIYYNSYKGADGSVVDAPKIWAWRYFGKGANRKKMEMTAYLDKNGGKARSGASLDVCRVFVCNVVIVGESSSTETGVWSEQYEKLSITKLGLVANPKLSGGGYFGRGGSRYKDKVK